MPKPRVFIGSSKEALKYAKAIKSKLQDVASLKVWDENIWSPGLATLENLIKLLPAFDFAILILTSDDLVKSRGVRTYAPRDNIIFELGLFMGHLGRFRTFFLCDSKPKMLKIPTDLSGITYVPFEGKARNARTAVADACKVIRREIRTQGVLRLFESQLLTDRIKMSTWEDIYKRAAKLVLGAQSRIRATAFGIPIGLRDLKSEYFKSIAIRAAEQKRRNVDFMYKAVCSNKRDNPQRDTALLTRKKIFEKYGVFDCLDVREVEGSGRVDFLIVDDKHLHISFQQAGNRKLAFGLELEDAEKLVHPIVQWYDECLFDKAKPINWTKVH